MRLEIPGFVLLALGMSSLMALPAAATPPPLSFALQAAAEGANERREAPWTLTLVEDRVQTLEARDASPRRVVFSGEDDRRMESRSEGPSPLQFLWAFVFSSEPAALHDLGPMPTAVAPTYEVVSGALAVCYTATEAGESHRLCFDETFRHIVLARMELDDATWELQMTADATSITIARDGSLVARLRRP